MLMTEDLVPAAHPLCLAFCWMLMALGNHPPLFPRFGIEDLPWNLLEVSGIVAPKEAPPGSVASNILVLSILWGKPEIVW